MRPGRRARPARRSTARPGIAPLPGQDGDRKSDAADIQLRRASPDDPQRDMAERHRGHHRERHSNRQRDGGQRMRHDHPGERRHLQRSAGWHRRHRSTQPGNNLPVDPGGEHRGQGEHRQELSHRRRFGTVQRIHGRPERQPHTRGSHLTGGRSGIEREACRQTRRESQHRLDKRTRHQRSGIARKHRKARTGERRVRQDQRQGHAQRAGNRLSFRKTAPPNTTPPPETGPSENRTDSASETRRELAPPSINANPVPTSLVPQLHRTPPLSRGARALIPRPIGLARSRRLPGYAPGPREEGGSAGG